MPRIRTVKPELATDVKLARVSRDARYTFVLLITQADDEGLVAGSPRQLLGTLYPHDDGVSGVMLLGWLEELEAIGVVRWRATRAGAPVVELVNWTRHQRVDHKGRSQLATELQPVSEQSAPVAETGQNGDAREAFARPSRDSRAPTLDLGPGTLDLGPPTKERVLAGRKRHGRDTHGTAARTNGADEHQSAAFAEFWQRYPHRAGGNPKPRAFKAWCARLRSGVPAGELLAGVDRYRAYVEHEGKAGTEFVMQAATFLGPDLRYAESWDLPAGDGDDALERRVADEARQLEENQRWLEQRKRERGLVSTEVAP